MRLDIVVPRYKEPWEVCRYLFDSIALQRGIELADVRVILVNDGEEDVLDPGLWMGYPYGIDYIVKPHGGVSNTRNAGIDAADADYVMFCDADDGFLSNYGLHLLFAAMQEGAPMITSCFVEEVLDRAAGVMRIVQHAQDPTFLHGKAYRLDWLRENDIRFDDDLTLHEDTYFNNLAVVYAQEARRDIGTPFYLWRWNDASTVRRDTEGNFVLKTYPKLVQVRTRICEEMARRGFDDAFRLCVVKTITDFYYDFNKAEWNDVKNRRDIEAAEKAFRAFYMTYQKFFLRQERGYIADILESSRAMARKNGFLIERRTLADWLKHIEYDVKP